MAQRSVIATTAACLFSFGFAQNSPAPADPAGSPEITALRTLQHSAFAPGEKLTYVLHYGWLNAGVATLELKEAPDVGGRKVLHAVGLGAKAESMFAEMNAGPGAVRAVLEKYVAGR